MVLSLPDEQLDRLDSRRDIVIIFSCVAIGDAIRFQWTLITSMALVKLSRSQTKRTMK